MGRKDLIRMEYQNSLSVKLTPLKGEEEENGENEELPEVKLPLRLERLKSDPYLDERGFKAYHYALLNPLKPNLF